MALCTLYGLGFQTRLFGDGPGLVAFHALGRGDDYHHVLYLPVLRLLESLLGSGDPFTAPRVAAFAAAGLGGGLAYGVARGLGARGPQALVGVLLMALSPAVWFYGTAIEVYSLHYVAVSLCACLTLFAPWRRPAAALAVVALAFPLLNLTHQTAALLGPGWVALVAYARARRAPAFRLRTLILGVGPLLLAVLIGSMGLANVARGRGLGLHLGAEVAFIEAFSAASTVPSFLWRGWLAPLALLLPAAALGLLRARAEPPRLVALAVLMGVPLVVFSLWSVPERGGYFLATAPFYAAAAALALPASGWRLALVGLALVGVQAALARRSIERWDRGFDPVERVEAVRRALGEGGVLVSVDNHAVPIEVFLPGVEEIHATAHWIVPAVEADLPTEAFAAAGIEFLDMKLRSTPVAFDMSFYRLPELRRTAYTFPYMDALLARVEERYRTTAFPHPDWSMLRVELPPE